MLSRFRRCAFLVLFAPVFSALSGCTWFASADCGGEAETRLVSKLLLETGLPVGVVLAAAFENSSVGPNLTLNPDGSADLKAVSDRVKALLSPGAAVFEIRTIITKEKRSRKSVTCSAAAHFASAPPANYPQDRPSTEIWKSASDTHWLLTYTVEVTDKGDGVLVSITDSKCEGLGCEAALALKQLAMGFQNQLANSKN